MKKMEWYHVVLPIAGVAMVLLVKGTIVGSGLTPALGTKAMQKALSQNGVKEQGTNAGKEVKDYLAAVGLSTGYAWCAAFVYWCFKQVATVNNVPKTAGVQAMYNSAVKNQVKVPQAGDVFVMFFTGGRGHCGFVTKVEGAYIYTIEGNSNKSASREGDGVYEHKRPINTIKGFLRF